MLQVNIPEKLTHKINEFAKMCCQTPEEYSVELIEERIAHDSAYDETAYLAKSKTNRERLNKAINDIRSGEYESHDLSDD